MKFQSANRRRLMSQVQQDRQAFLVLYPACWFCGGPSQCVHEMACGSHRELALSEPCTWAAACVDCNEFHLTDYSEWPLARQMAVKWIEDRKNFDRVRFNAIRGRSPDAISWTEVVLWICRELNR